MRVVYHIGAHKTGTSLIQKFMRDNPEPLAANRIHYLPRSEIEQLVGRGERLLTSPEDLAGRIETVAHAGRDRLLVTSHEDPLGRPIAPGGPHLYPSAPRLVDALRTLLAPYDTRVFLSIRPQADFLESYYLQLIHEGNHFSFADWTSTFDVERVSWAPLVEMLRSAFGDTNVEIIDFRLITRGQNDFLREFFRRVDPDIEIDIDYRPRRNPSVSEKGLALALAANPLLRNHRERKAMRTFLQARFSNRAYPRPQLLTEAERERIEAFYEHEYASLTGHAYQP
jgi:hypothetical protein